jgi:hypothetical protein
MVDVPVVPHHGMGFRPVGGDDGDAQASYKKQVLQWTVDDWDRWAVVCGFGARHVRVELKNETTEVLVPVPEIGHRVTVRGYRFDFTQITHTSSGHRVMAKLDMHLPPGERVLMDVEWFDS